MSIHPRSLYQTQNSSALPTPKTRVHFLHPKSECEYKQLEEGERDHCGHFQPYTTLGVSWTTKLLYTLNLLLTQRVQPTNTCCADEESHPIDHCQESTWSHCSFPRDCGGFVFPRSRFLSAIKSQGREKAAL